MVNETVFPSTEEFDRKLSEIFEENQLSHFLNDRSRELFYRFTRTLWETNKNLNLTALTSIPDMILKHLADSLLIAPHLAEGATVIDVGCGGGFPTFPLAIARPDLRITALDSTEKKICFVRSTAHSLGLSNVTAICGRAEDLAKGDMRECFDHVTARAVAALPILCELCIPFVKPGGSFVAMKSLRIDEELAAAKKKDLFLLLGGESTPVIHTPKLTSNGEDLFRCIAVTKKLSPTPPKYPRAYTQIVKSNKA